MGEILDSIDARADKLAAKLRPETPDWIEAAADRLAAKLAPQQQFARPMPGGPRVPTTQEEAAMQVLPGIRRGTARAQMLGAGGLTATGAAGKFLDMPHRWTFRIPGRLLGQLPSVLRGQGDLSFGEAWRESAGGLPGAIEGIITPEWAAEHPTATKGLAYGAGIPLEIAGDVALGLGAGLVKGGVKAGQIGLRVRKLVTPGGWKAARKAAREVAEEAIERAPRRLEDIAEAITRQGKDVAESTVKGIKEELVERAARRVKLKGGAKPGDILEEYAEHLLKQHGGKLGPQEIEEAAKQIPTSKQLTELAASKEARLRVGPPKAAVKAARRKGRAAGAGVLWERETYGIPGTQRVTKLGRQVKESQVAQAVSRQFTPEGVPIEPLSREAWEKGAEVAGPEAAYRSLLEADPRARQIVEKGLTEDELARASIASEFYKKDPKTGKYRIPQGIETQYAEEMMLSPKEEATAGLIAEMHQETGAVRQRLGIPTGEPAPKLARRIRKVWKTEIPAAKTRLRKRLTEQLSERVTKGKRLTRVAEQTEARAEKLLGKAARPVKKRAEALAQKITKQQLLDVNEAYNRANRAAAAGKADLARKLRGDALKQSRDILSRETLAARNEAGKLDALARRIEKGERLGTLKTELRAAFPKTRRGAEEYAQSLSNLKDFYAARTAAESASKKAQRLLSITPEKATAQYRALLARSKKLGRLAAKARMLDEEVTRIPGYYARSIAKERRLGIAVAGGKETIRIPRAHGLSGATRPRGFTVKSGRPMYLWETEKDLRRAAYDTDFAARHPYLKELSSQLQDTGIWQRLKAVARKAPREKVLIKGLYELDPVRSIKMSIARNVNDAKQVGFIKALGEFAEVKPRPGWVPADRMGPLAAQFHKGKYFPPEVAHEVKRVLNNIAGIDNKFLRAYDRALSVWRVSVTSPFPSFHVRNSYSDNILMAANGPYNPFKVHKYGRTAVLGRGTMTINGLGTIDAREAFLLAEAYGVTGGRLQLETGKGIGALRKITSIPEEIRRAGYFLERIDSGMSPLEAAIETKKVLFDYSRLGPLERKVLRRVIPFWSWTRNSIPHTVKTTVTKPYWTAAQLRIVGAGREKAVPAEQLPSYMQKSLHIATSQPGMATVIYGIGFPIADAMNLIDDLGNPKELAKQLWWQTAPIITGLMKIGVRLGTGRTMQDVVPAPRGAENLSDTSRDMLGIHKEGERYVMPRYRREIMRPLRFASELFRIARAETPADAFVTFLTGLSRIEYSDAELMQNAVRNQMRALQEQLEAEGKTREFTVKPTVPSAKRDPRALELRRLRKINSRLRKRIEREKSK